MNMISLDFLLQLGKGQASKFNKELVEKYPRLVGKKNYFVEHNPEKKTVALIAYYQPRNKEAKRSTMWEYTYDC